MKRLIAGLVLAAGLAGTARAGAYADLPVTQIARGNAFTRPQTQPFSPRAKGDLVADRILDHAAATIMKRAERANPEWARDGAPFVIRHGDPTSLEWQQGYEELTGKDAPVTPIIRRNIARADARVAALVRT